jgi:hypothetical protein
MLGSGGVTECEAAAGFRFVGVGTAGQLSRCRGYQTSGHVIGAAVARYSTYSTGPSSSSVTAAMPSPSSE